MIRGRTYKKNEKEATKIANAFSKNRIFFKWNVSNFQFLLLIWLTLMYQIYTETILMVLVEIEF